MPNKINNADILIKKLNLTHHVEGGYYRRYYQSDLNINREDKVIRKAGSAIYYLLKKGEYSA